MTLHVCFETEPPRCTFETTSHTCTFEMTLHVCSQNGTSHVFAFEIAFRTCAYEQLPTRVFLQ